MSSNQEPKILRLRVELEGIHPTVWREFEVPEDMSLDGLHRTINAAMGWYEHHLYEFETKYRRYGVPTEGSLGTSARDARTTEIGEVLSRAGDALQYLYDFGDKWRLELRVVERGEASSDVMYPRLLDGARAAPPEGCGGPEAYRAMLEQFARHGELDEDFAACVEGEFAPDRFELEEHRLPDIETLETPPLAESPPQPAIEGEEIEVAIEQMLGSMLKWMDDEQKEFMSEQIRGIVRWQQHLPLDFDEEVEDFPRSRELVDCLDRLPVEQLDAIATSAERAAQARRGPRARAIADRLLTPASLGALLAGLDATSLDLLAEIVASRQPVAARWLFLSGYDERRRAWLTFDADTALGRLRRSGLVHVGLRLGENDASITDRLCVGVADDLRQRLREQESMRERVASIEEALDREFDDLSSLLSSV